MMYKVIYKFKDTDERVYQVGDVYPHADAKKPTSGRVKTLSTTSNKYKQIFIEKVE